MSEGMMSTAERHKERQRIRREKGLCVNCSQSAEIGNTRCRVCQSRRLAQQKSRKDNLRKLAIEFLGGEVCKCCGESKYDFLTIDHVNNDGYIRRLEYGRNYVKFYNVILSGVYRDSLQVLCLNCNLGKNRNGGVCPHLTLDVPFVCCYNQIPGSRKRCCDNREKITAPSYLLSRRRLQWAVYSKYSGGGVPVCNCCGENDPFFLTVDHINNDGVIHRNIIDHGKIWKKLLSSPVELRNYQVLCYNCNTGRDWQEGKVCPHKR